MRARLIVSSLLAAALSCREQPPEQRQVQAPPAPAPAPTDVSHGEAAIGTTEQPAPVNPAAPPLSTDYLHRVRLEMRHVRLTIAADVSYEAGTYPFVTHAFADATKGEVGMFEAKGP